MSMPTFTRTQAVITFCVLALVLAVGWLADSDFDGFPIDSFRPNDRVRSAHNAVSPVRSPEPFGLDAERAPDGELWTKWRRVENALREEMDVIARCRAQPEACGSPAANQFIAIVDDARLYTGRARLGSVNQAINKAIRYASDPDQHGVDDHWNAPLESLATGHGDCEDYAIAKLVALREAGVAEEHLRLVIVRDVKLREFHAALAAKVNGRWIVLDNRQLAMAEDSDLRHFVPLFAIRQGVGVMQFAQAGSPRHIGADSAPGAPSSRGAAN
jgi:predicted transglutaminase-like cysteine proteinase